MSLFPRKIRANVEEALGDTPVVLIVGPRQAGKSTLAEQIGADRGFEWVTLDEDAARETALADPTGFLAERGSPLIIDEFQKAPNLLDGIKLRVDQARRGGRRAAGMYLLTGSARIWATLRVSESLAGRAERIHLWPLSQSEREGTSGESIASLFDGRPPRVLDAPVGRRPVAERLTVGGFPEMVARPSSRRRSLWVRDYVAMVVERDVGDLSPGLQQLDELPRLLGALAARTGNLLNVTSVAGELGMDRKTATRYLRLLELLFLVERTPAWSRSLGRRLIKSPKLMIADSGLAAALLDFSPERFVADDTAIAGGLFENFVASELRKELSWSSTYARLFHLRTAGGTEVDLVLEAPDGSVVGVEVKLSATPRPSDLSGLRLLRERLGPRFRCGALIYAGRETLPFGERLWAMPVSALWS